MKRRDFMRNTGLATAGLGLVQVLPSGVLAGTPPSDKVQVALIGCNNMGFGVLKHALGFDDVTCVALCDVDENVLREKADQIEKDFGQQPALFSDFRKLLEQKDVDAVFIGSPDHWHCLHYVYALQAGKDVYVEKPMANSIGECNVMVAAAKRYSKQVVQIGQQQRSGEPFIAAMDWVKNGKIGKLRKVNVWANFNYGLGPAPAAATPVPNGVDYDFWLGPAPQRAFHPNRFHGSWRHFWDYGGGLMSDFGVHLLDIALWSADLLEGPATSLVYAANISPEKRDRETFDTMSVVFPKKEYAIHFDLTAGVQQGPYNMLYGLAFVGDSATLVVNRGGLQVFPEWDGEKKQLKAPEFKLEAAANESHKQHVRNFIDGVKSRKAPVCTPEIGRAAALHAHIPNIAARVGEPMLEWDEKANRFTNSKAANALLMPEYRKPWKIPQF